MALAWDLWIDYHRCDNDGYTRIHPRHLESDVELVPGSFIVVGNEEADPAVAEVVSIDSDGMVLVRVLPAPAEDHLHLTRHGPSSTSG